MQVSLTDLYATARWLETKTEDFQGDVDKLMAEVRSVIGTSWQGNSSEGNREAWSEWFTRVRALLEALGSHATMLRSSADAYHADDTNLATSLYPLSGDAFRSRSS